MSLKASCHCGAIQLQVETAPAQVTSCNCSYCSRIGALRAYYPAADVRLITARDRVSTYQFGSYAGQHHHCSVCGCPTHSEFPDFSTGRPDFENPQVSINARLFEGFDVESVPLNRLNGKADW